MKKLISILIIAIMHFNVVITPIEGGLEVFVDHSENFDNEINNQYRLKQKNLKEYEEIFNYLKSILDKYGFSDEALNKVLREINKLIKNREIQNFKNLIKAIIKILIYLAKNINNKERILEFYDKINLKIPYSLDTSENIKKTIEATSEFCDRFGAICILQTGDTINSDGKAYNYEGKPYENLEALSEDRLYWFYSCPVLVDGKEEGRFSAIFILPNGRCIKCDNINNIYEVNLEEVKSISNEKIFRMWGENIKKINISKKGKVIFQNGIKISTQNKEPINDVVISVLANGLTPLIVDITQHGDARAYIVYIMKYWIHIDRILYHSIYSNEENLINFVYENFCLLSINTAIDAVQKCVYKKRHI